MVWNFSFCKSEHYLHRITDAMVKEIDREVLTIFSISVYDGKY